MEEPIVANMEEYEPKICEPGGRGMIFPFVASEQEMEPIPRAIIYALVMMYLFLGVNIVADKFMSSIEMITSTTKRILVKGTTSRYITVKKWNPTVANITLMALGSSAPEILLSIVEMIRNEFTAGDLGPSTIVGSAAFNLFVIIAVCIVSIPSPETREIKETGVFFVTSVFSLLAYIWLVVIVLVTSPDVISIWEGAVTLAMFPILTFVSHRTDVGWCSRKGQTPTIFQEEGTVINSFKSICDTKGNPIENDAGVFSFQSDYMEVSVGEQSEQEMIHVFRCNGRKGCVSCKYRTVSCKAVADRDFCETHGELYFDNGESMKEFPVVLLHKEKWESDDYFQIRLEDCSGGAIFNPLDDGGEECCILTIQIRNKNKDLLQRNTSYKVRNFVDSHLNVDMMSVGWKKWKTNLKDAILEVSEEEVPSCFDWFFHIISVPWKLVFALLCPPPEYCWGWVCFTMALFWIGAMTAIIIDFAELFGCVTTLKDAVTAITIVALGTSMPDLFASITAASEAAVYWQVVGATPEWTSENAGFLDNHPEYRSTGAFVVIGGDLAFGVAVFTVAAIIGLGIIRGRRLLYGGELGGPSATKWASGGSLACLWFFYIALATWKSYDPSASFNRQMAVLLIGIYVVVVFMFLLGITSKLIDCAKLLRGDADAEDDEDVPLTDKIIETSDAAGGFKAHENPKLVLQERALPQADVALQIEAKVRNIEEVAPLMGARSDIKQDVERSGQPVKSLDLPNQSRTSIPTQASMPTSKDAAVEQAAVLSNGRAPDATAAAPSAASPAALPTAPSAVTESAQAAAQEASRGVRAAAARAGSPPARVAAAGFCQKPEPAAAAAAVELKRGMRVRVVGTSQKDLNDQIGVFDGFYEDGQERRWKVAFAGGKVAALRRQNLEAVPTSPVDSTGTQQAASMAAAASAAVSATSAPAIAGAAAVTPAGTVARTAAAIEASAAAARAAPSATATASAAATAAMTAAAAAAGTTPARAAPQAAFPSNVPRADQSPTAPTAGVTDGHSALHVAVMNGSEVQVSKCLSEGADVNVATPEDLQTPLHLAVVHGYKNIVQRLLDAGATSNAPNAQGETPLHQTAYYGHPDIAGALLKARAQVNAKDVRERTALHIAAMRAQDAMAEVLLASGADLNAKSGAGYTPLAMAQDWGSSSIAQLLEKRGGWRRSGPGDHDDAQPSQPSQKSIDIRVPPGAPGTTIQVPLPTGSFVSVHVPPSAQVNEVYRIQIPTEAAGSSVATIAKPAPAAQPSASSQQSQAAAQPVAQAAAQPPAQAVAQASAQAAASAKGAAKPVAQPVAQLAGKPAVQPTTQPAAQPATQQAAQPSAAKPMVQPGAASAPLPSAAAAAAAAVEHAGARQRAAPLADASAVPASSSAAPPARELAAPPAKAPVAAAHHGAAAAAAPSIAASSTATLGAATGLANRSSVPAAAVGRNTSSHDRSAAPAPGAAASSTAAPAAAEEAPRVEWV